MPQSRYEFDWDPSKAEANIAKHGVAFELAMTVFLDPLAMSRFDDDNSDDEPRWVRSEKRGMPNSWWSCIPMPIWRQTEWRFGSLRPAAQPDAR